MKVPMHVQLQVQPREVDQIKEHTLPKQKEGIQTPLTKPTADRLMTNARNLYNA